MVHVEVLDTSDLGDRSYVAHDGTHAVVVDPQRDIDRVEEVLAERGLRCVAVLETHMHNDYVTGGLELARRTAAEYVVNAADPVQFDREPVSDGDQRTFGAMRVTVLATPGHTVTHLSYVVEDAGDPGDTAAEAGPAAVFTGGSLLYGSRGPHRPGRRGAHRRADPGPVPLRASPRRAARRHPGLPHARVRQLLLLRAPRPAATPRPSPRSAPATTR